MEIVLAPPPLSGRELYEQGDYTMAFDALNDEVAAPEFKIFYTTEEQLELLHYYYKAWAMSRSDRSNVVKANLNMSHVEGQLANHPVYRWTVSAVEHFGSFGLWWLERFTELRSAFAHPTASSAVH